MLALTCWIACWLISSVTELLGQRPHVVGRVTEQVLSAVSWSSMCSPTLLRLLVGRAASHGRGNLAQVGGAGDVTSLGGKVAQFGGKVLGSPSRMSRSDIVVPFVDAGIELCWLTILPARKA